MPNLVSGWIDPTQVRVHEMGRRFPKHANRVPVTFGIDGDATAIHEDSSPYPVNTLAAYTYAMDGRNAVGQMRYRVENGRILPTGELTVATDHKVRVLEELATEFLRGWLETTLIRRATVAHG